MLANKLACLVIASLNLLLYRKPWRSSMTRLEHHLPTSPYLSASDILHLASDWSSWTAAQQLQDLALAADAAVGVDNNNDDNNDEDEETEEEKEEDIVTGTETQST